MDSDIAREQILWRDRFNTPTPARLREQLDEARAELFDEARQRLTASNDTKETLLWHGIPWRWTLVYTLRACPDKPWSYLIPNPDALQIAIAITPPTVEAIQSRKLPKNIREGLAQAPSVDGVAWTQWELTSRTQAQELLSLAEKQLEALRAGH